MGEFTKYQALLLDKLSQFSYDISSMDFPYYQNSLISEFINLKGFIF